MIVRCVAPRRKDPTRPCDGFVADVPDGSALVRLLVHSAHKGEGRTVAGCRDCRQLHEIAPPTAAPQMLHAA